MPSNTIKNKNHSTSIMFSRILYGASGGRKIREFELIRELEFFWHFWPRIRIQRAKIHYKPSSNMLVHRVDFILLHSVMDGVSL